MSSNHLELDLTVGKEKEGLYFNLPFEVPQGVERIDIRYRYERYHSYTNGLMSIHWTQKVKLFYAA